MTNKLQPNDGDIPSSTRTYSDTDLEFARNEYKSNLNTIESIATIKRGVMYAAMLTIVKRRIEAQRLVTKLATISRRVHGPEHSILTTRMVLMMMATVLTQPMSKMRRLRNLRMTRMNTPMKMTCPMKRMTKM